LRCHEAANVEIMVINPRVAAHFAKALNQRGKTDAADAAMLMEYAATRPFTAWTPPSATALQLRQISRLVQELVEQRTQQKNRIHAAEQTGSTLPAVLDTLRAHVQQLDEHIDTLEEAALALIATDPVLSRRFALLDSIPGVAARSALYILAELACLPDDLDVRQLVAFAGLDPRPWQSGTSIRGRRHVSKRGNKHLRHALYMPAVQAARFNPVIKAYAAELDARLEGRKQTLCVVMRKILHSIVGMFKADKPFDARKFRRAA